MSLKSSPFQRLGWLACKHAWIAFGLLTASVLHASETDRKAFDLDAGSAEQTLKLFTAQSGVELIYPTNSVEGIRTNPVHGQYEPIDALQIMLAGTPLNILRDQKAGVFAIRLSNDPKADRMAEAPVRHPETTPGDPDEVVALPKFQVVGTSVDPYNSSETSSVARTAGKILDTPVTAYEITPAIIQDLNPASLFDVAQYFAGVSPGRISGAEGFEDRINFRGFENLSRTVDNFSEALLPWMDATFNNFDPLFMDHAELIMGPDAILSPTGTPGGTVSVITKSPQYTPSIDLTAQVGNFDAGKYSVDATGPLGTDGKWAYRVIAGYEDTETYMPGSIIAQLGSLELEYRFSDTASWTIKYFGTQQRLGGVPTGSGEVVYTPNTVGGVTLPTSSPQPGFPYQGWDGNATWDYLITRDNTLETELTAALSPTINMRLAGQLYDSNFHEQGVYPSPVTSETWNPVTGQETSVTPINPAAIPELARDYEILSRQVQVQNDYAGNFEAGPVSLQPLVGAAFWRGDIPDFWFVQDKNMPTANAFEPYDPAQPPLSAYTLNTENTPESGWTMQGYGYLRTGFFNNRLFVTGGAARVWAGVTEYVKPYTDQDGVDAGAPGPVVEKTFSNTGNPLLPSVQPWHDTYVGGILGKVTPNVSLYYNYSSNAALASNAPLWQAGVQNEFGVKTSWFDDRLTVSADHFEIRQSNISYTNPLFTIGQSSIQTIYSDEANHGEELNIQGRITKNISVVASYTNMKLRDAFGRRIRNTPDNMANLLIDYRFTDSMLKNLDVFAGVIHEGQVAGETVAGFTSLGVPEQPGYYVPAYNVLNAGAGYKFGRYRINLNVGNVLNSKFWWEAQSRSSLSPYPGTRVEVTCTVHL
jgi:iron complex outermembrane recepter protein